MLIDAILSALAIAGTSALWRNLQEDIPAITQTLEKYVPWPLRQSLTCGFCFTYWLSLFFLVFSNPFHAWTVPLRISFGPLSSLITLGIEWMALAISAAFVRFAYVNLQELTHYLVKQNELLEPLKIKRRQ